MDFSSGVFDPRDAENSGTPASSLSLIRRFAWGVGTAFQQPPVQGLLACWLPVRYFIWFLYVRVVIEFSRHFWFRMAYAIAPDRPRNNKILAYDSVSRSSTNLHSNRAPKQSLSRFLCYSQFVRLFSSLKLTWESFNDASCEVHHLETRQSPDEGSHA